MSDAKKSTTNAFETARALVPAEDIKGGTETFFWNLFGPYMARQACIEVRCLPLDRDRKAAHAGKAIRPAQRWFPVVRFRDAAAYAASQAETSSVYMGVLPRIQGGGGAEHVRECAWLWCDIDGGDGTVDDAGRLLVEAMQKKHLPAPHLIVCSGGGYHCYWRLASPVRCRTSAQQEAIRKVLKRLVLAIGGSTPGAHADVASTDPARILRVPGSWNHKQETPRYVFLRSLHPEYEAHSLTWWEGTLPPEPHPITRRPAPRPAKTESGGGGESKLFPATIQKMILAAADGTKHYTMRAVAVAARKAGFGDAEIANFAEQVGWVSGLDMNSPAQMRHLRGLVDWTMRSVLPDPGG